ncbi:unnamed protein product [Mycena citricolor]|uniref:Uncharacterized protein n=1 Tax=Mycena citricolor TaxID=2018698 RepID=A0AAD2K845_9AGAR|nr:unnamed protein product [Mycena citricolor]
MLMCRCVSRCCWVGSRINYAELRLAAFGSTKLLVFEEKRIGSRSIGIKIQNMPPFKIPGEQEIKDVWRSLPNISNLLLPKFNNR